MFTHKLNNNTLEWVPICIARIPEVKAMIRSLNSQDARWLQVPSDGQLLGCHRRHATDQLVANYLGHLLMLVVGDALGVLHLAILTVYFSPQPVKSHAEIVERHKIATIFGHDVGQNVDRDLRRLIVPGTVSTSVTLFLPICTLIPYMFFCGTCISTP